MSAKSLKVAYFLLAIFGLQGFHQFYLGNYKRGALILLLTHLPLWGFAHMIDKAGGDPLLVGEIYGIFPLLAILISLLLGTFLLLQDLFTLRRQTNPPPSAR